MVDIMAFSHQYVPDVVGEKQCLDNGETVTVIKSSLNPILFGVDQLTASLARSAKKAKLNSVKSVTRLDGLVPVAENWHSKLNFLTVSTIMSL